MRDAEHKPEPGYSNLVHFQIKPKPVPSRYVMTQKQAFLRMAAALLNLSEQYLDDHIDLHSAESDEDEYQALESQHKIAQASMLFSKDDLPVSNYVQIPYDEQSSQDMLKAINRAVRNVHQAIRVIQKKGGQVYFGRKQLVHLFAQAQETMDDLVISNFTRIAAYLKMKQTRDLPSPVETALDVVVLSNDENVNIDTIGAVIMQDAALSARLLKYANSAYYSTTNPVATIPRALVRLGLKAVRTIALSVSLVNENKTGVCEGFSYGQFWSESVARAVSVRHMAGHKHGKVDPDEAFTVGLLSEIGRLAFATAFPKSYGAILSKAEGDSEVLLTLERKEYGLNHHELSAAMLADWRLPDYYSLAVEYQGMPEMLAKGSMEYEMARMIPWSGMVSMVLTRCELQREMLEVMIEEARHLGIEQEHFGRSFDMICQNWQKVGDVFEVETRDVEPWSEMYPPLF